MISIKCRMLLPKEVNEEGEEEDPREELVRQLLEYKMYKYMSYELRDRMAAAAKNVYKGPSIPKEVLSYKEPVDAEELLDGSGPSLKAGQQGSGDCYLSFYSGTDENREDPYQPEGNFRRNLY